MISTHFFAVFALLATAIDAKIVEIGDGCSLQTLPSQLLVHPTTQPELICTKPKCIALGEFEIKCSENWSKNACTQEEQWTSGVGHQIRGNRVDLVSQCCASDGIREIGTKRIVILNETASFLGGNVVRGGRVIAFDVVKSLRRIINGEKVNHELTIQRIPCEKKIPFSSDKPLRSLVKGMKLHKKARAFAAPIGQEALPVPLDPEVDYIDENGNRVDPSQSLQMENGQFQQVQNENGFQQVAPPAAQPTESEVQIQQGLQDAQLFPMQQEVEASPAAAAAETVEVVEQPQPQPQQQQQQQQQSYMGQMRKYIRRLINEYEETASGDDSAPLYISNPQAQQPVAQYTGQTGQAGGQAGGYSGFGSGIYCFSGDSQVETPTGMVAMKDLQKGDSVLSIQNSMISYSPVVMFLHKVDNAPTVFLALTVSDDSTLKLTPEHLIYKSKCDNSHLELTAAKNVAVGECLFTRSHKLVKVVSVEEVEEMGYYAPLTATGDIYVNGLLCSCYSNSNLKFVLDGLFSMMRTIDSWSESFALPQIFESESQLPLGVSFLAENVKSFLLM